MPCVSKNGVCLRACSRLRQRQDNGDSERFCECVKKKNPTMLRLEVYTTVTSHWLCSSVCLHLHGFLGSANREESTNYHADITLVVSWAIVSMFIYDFLCKRVKEHSYSCRTTIVCLCKCNCSVLETYGLCMTHWCDTCFKCKLSPSQPFSVHVW